MNENPFNSSNRVLECSNVDNDNALECMQME